MRFNASTIPIFSLTTMILFASSFIEGNERHYEIMDADSQSRNVLLANLGLLAKIRLREDVAETRTDDRPVHASPKFRTKQKVLLSFLFLITFAGQAAKT